MQNVEDPESEYRQNIAKYQLGTPDPALQDTLLELLQMCSDQELSDAIDRTTDQMFEPDPFPGINFERRVRRAGAAEEAEEEPVEE